VCSVIDIEMLIHSGVFVRDPQQRPGFLLADVFHALGGDEAECIPAG
jgi:hypothetical protein